MSGKADERSAGQREKLPVWFEQYLKWREHANVLHSRSVGSKWAINGDEDKRFLALSLCGEAGELANKIKKVWRGDKNDNARMGIWEELADVRIFVELLAIAYDCPLDAMCVLKLEDFEKRLGGSR